MYFFNAKVGVLNVQRCKTIISDNADVYTEDGKLLLRFRKNKLNKENIKSFYDNVIHFAVKKTGNRGSATGTKIKTFKFIPRIMTNILGYFDKLSPNQKIRFKELGKPLPKITVRETRFLQEYPDNFTPLDI